MGKLLGILSTAASWVTGNARWILVSIGVAGIVGIGITFYVTMQENQRLRLQHGADQQLLQSEHAAVTAATDAIKEWAESAKRFQESLDAYSSRQKQIAETVRSMTNDLSAITKRSKTDPVAAERELNRRFNGLLGLLRGPEGGLGAPGDSAARSDAAHP